MGTAPTPQGVPLLGHLVAMQRDPLSLVVRMMCDHGPLVRLRFGPRVVHLATHPDVVREVLQTKQQSFNKQTDGFKQVQLIVGQGLLTSDGAFWRRQRRIAQPAFHKTRLAGFGDTMVRAATGLAERWDRAADRREPVDVDRDLMALTLEIVADTLLSARTDGLDMQALGNAIDFLLVDVRRRMSAPFHIPLSVPLPSNVEFRRSLGVLDRVIGDIIARRRSGSEKRDDLLQMLLDAEDAETGERMTDSQLRDEAMTMFLAGHETTASALSWTLMLLSRHPEARRRLAEELDDVLGGGPPSLDDLPRLAYTGQVLDEAMRLYPPAWLFARQTSEPVQIGGCAIEDDSAVLIAPYAVHRHPDYWSNPLAFDPDRFSPDRAKEHHKFQHLPFGAGSRKCIGAGFAVMEAKIILATLAQRFTFELLPARPPVPEPALTLRPRDLRMRIAHVS
jgi:cytochrome P450